MYPVEFDSLFHVSVFPIPLLAARKLEDATGFPLGKDTREVQISFVKQILFELIERVACRIEDWRSTKQSGRKGFGDLLENGPAIEGAYLLESVCVLWTGSDRHSKGCILVWQMEI